MDLKEKKLSGEVLYSGKVVRLEKDRVLCPNGITSYREIIRHPGGAAILCITKDRQVLLIKQYRYAYDDFLYEIPAGKLEVGEDPEKAALREFEEETGNKAKTIEFLNVIYPSCGYTSEKIYLYFVKDFDKSQTHFDEDEVIETQMMAYEDVLKAIQEGKIQDAKTICALMSYHLRYE